MKISKDNCIKYINKSKKVNPKLFKSNKMAKPLCYKSIKVTHNDVEASEIYS